MFVRSTFTTPYYRPPQMILPVACKISQRLRQFCQFVLSTYLIPYHFRPPIAETADSGLLPKLTVIPSAVHTASSVDGRHLTDNICMESDSNSGPSLVADGFPFRTLREPESDLLPSTYMYNSNTPIGRYTKRAWVTYATQDGGLTLEERHAKEFDYARHVPASMIEARYSRFVSIFFS